MNYLQLQNCRRGCSIKHPFNYSKRNECENVCEANYNASLPENIITNIAQNNNEMELREAQLRTNLVARPVTEVNTSIRPIKSLGGLNAAIQQQLGGSQGGMSKAVEDLGDWELIKDYAVGNLVPAGSRMPSKIRMFKQGEIVQGKMVCDEAKAEPCYIHVESGMTYRFPASGVLKPAGINPNETPTIDTPEDGGTRVSADVETSEPSFFEKNKTPILIGAALVVAFIGYKMLKKNK